MATTGDELDLDELTALSNDVGLSHEDEQALIAELRVRRSVECSGHSMDYLNAVGQMEMWQKIAEERKQDWFSAEERCRALAEQRDLANQRADACRAAEYAERAAALRAEENARAAQERAANNHIRATLGEQKIADLVAEIRDLKATLARIDAFLMEGARHHCQECAIQDALDVLRGHDV